MKEICDTYKLKHLVTEATCFKPPENSSSIDLILTNRIRSFQNTTILESGLSDDHKMVITVLKRFFLKQTPILIKYLIEYFYNRDYRKFNGQNFRQDLQNNILNITDDTCYDEFESTLKTIWTNMPLLRRPPTRITAPNTNNGHNTNNSPQHE